jgi:thymidylate synthase (FAD)
MSTVKLISLTKSVIPEADLTPEELIVYIARVSNPSNQLNTDTSEKLLKYLVKHKHWSPFEMVDMTVEIKTSRAIAAQILRHRSFSFQEFSQRYSEVTEFEPVELRKAGATNRQSSLEVFEPKLWRGKFSSGTSASIVIEDFLKKADELYKELIKVGVAKECARMILPLTTSTTIYMKGSIRSWIHYLQVRTEEGTQLEHRQVALAILDVLKNNFKNIFINE